MTVQRDHERRGGATEGQSSTARWLSLLLSSILVLGGAVGAGIFVADNMILERITALPVGLPVIFGTLTAIGVVLTFLVADRLVDLVRTQRQKLSGARMHRRLAAILSAVALIPAAVAFTLTGALVTSFTDEFFVDRIENSTSVALNLANAYADSVSRQMAFNILLAERDLRRGRVTGVGPEQAPIGYRKFLVGLSQLYEFSEVAHVDTAGRVIVRTALTGEPLPLPPLADLTPPEDDMLDVKFGAIDPGTLEVYYVVIPLQRGEAGYLIGYRKENPRIANELVGVASLRDYNVELYDRIRQIGSVTAFGFLLLSVVLILAAAWIGLLVANAIVGPIRRLATAAEKVSSGDLTSRVEVRRRDGELGELGRAFNDMTEQLAAQRDDLVAAGEDAENRRRFVETMLGAIPAGVVSLNREGSIGLANSSAASILGATPGELVGHQLAEVIPAVTRLFEQAQLTGRGFREAVEWNRGGEVRSLVIEISPETEHSDDDAGFVVTIEDITELITAQRTAAWADVARRIAHEIKNPLTPIQLSAERLKRRFAKELDGRDREIFDQCTETIVRHVGDIGRMVTEFSSFARMPEPIMAENDLCEIAREAVFPFPVAHPSISFKTRLPDHPVTVLCDGRLIAQALTNLIKNAAEAIDEEPERDGGHVEIEIIEERTGARIEVRDDGKGLPTELRHRLTEPYMTTRAKGTGLGLAIVRKAIEDHDGSFEIRNRPSGGAVALIFLPRLQSRPSRGNRDISATARQGEPAFHGH